MNAEGAQEVKTLLLQQDDQYRQLAEQHHQLDHRLHELSDKQYLSNSEQVEAVTLKKRKLALKDRMEAIARQHVHSRASLRVTSHKAQVTIRRKPLRFVI